MHQALADAMRDYFDAGMAMDIDRLDAIYDDEFENLRVDRAGRSITLSKAQFMARFRALKARGETVGESVDDVTFPASNVFGDHALIVMRRVENDEPVQYAFVWRLADGRPATILRELTFDHDISYLLAMVAATQS
jgi:ketosteroid isomerase-like protein